MSANSKPLYILGLSFFYHDSAAVLLKDGELLAAAEEERFSRKKHDEEFPREAINFCLQQAKISSVEISAVVFYDKPILKLERIIVSFAKSWPSEPGTFIKAIRLWLTKKLWVRELITKELCYSGPIYFSEHHLSHAASAFFVSSFQSAAILCVDGVGEWVTASLGVGADNKIKILKEIKYPNSLGLFYSAVTYFLGFEPNSDEYKVMGLAPYGRPIYKNKLQEIFQVFPDGSFVVKKFGGNFIVKKIESDLKKLLGFAKRNQGAEINQNHKDLAASLQALTDETMVKMAKYAREQTGEKNLCLAGGVALNCVANSEIFKKAGFENIFIQPAAGDAGGALGAAYFYWCQVLGRPRSFVFTHSFLGPEFSNDEIKKVIDGSKVSYEYMPSDKLLPKIAELINKEKIIGWFQGRMEWGPRSLGARSILADPRNKENWPLINQKVKFREDFRPFAPAVLKESAGEYFESPLESPFMLYVSKVKKHNIPAVIHIDGTARVQSVELGANPLFYELLREYEKLTGCPVLINTSFNASGEPIVCTPADALNTFSKTGIDFLVIGNYIISK